MFRCVPILLSVVAVLAGCGGGEDPSSASDSPGPLPPSGPASATPAPGGAGAIGRTVVLNPTPRAQEAKGLVLAPYEARRLTDEEARRTGWMAEAGQERVVAIGGTADFRLTTHEYSFGPMATVGSGGSRTWTDAAGVAVACDYGLLENAPRSIEAPLGSGPITRTELDWAPREIPARAQWTDDLRLAVLTGLDTMPGELVDAAQQGLDETRDRRLVPILLRIRAGLAQHSAYDRKGEDDRRLLFRLLGPEDAETLEAIEAELGRRKDPNRGALGLVAVAWAHLGQVERGRRLVPPGAEDRPSFFHAMGGAPAAAIWTLAGPLWDSLDRPGHEAAGKALVQSGEPLPVDATRRLAETVRRPGMIQLSADLLEPWEKLIQVQGADLGDRLGPMLDALLAHPNHDPANRAIDRLLLDPAGGWPVVLGAWPAIRADATRKRILTAVLAHEGSGPEAKMPFALAALDGSKEVAGPALAWLSAAGADLDAEARTRLLAAMERTKAKPEILWAGGPTWWSLLAERWAGLSEPHRTAALESVLDATEATLAQKRPILEAALADPVYRIVDQALAWSAGRTDLPPELRRKALEAALARGVGGHDFLRKIDPGWWGDVVRMWDRIQPRERAAVIAGALEREDAPDPARNSILDKGLDEEGHAQWDVLKWLCDNPREASSALRRKALQRAQGSGVPQWLAERVKQTLGK